MRGKARIQSASLVSPYTPTPFVPMSSPETQIPPRVLECFLTFPISNPTLDQEPQQELSRLPVFLLRALSKAQHTGTWADAWAE